jgi:hypothetical protein
VALVDVVVDTDVLAHADNRENANQQASRHFIHRLRATNTVLCVDEGFDIEEARNRSAIASEYFERLPPGGLGLVLVYECAVARRIRTVSTGVSQTTNRIINRLVWDKSDRKFVKVAVNSDEQVLVTDNTSDLEPPSDELRARLGVEIMDAYECHERL